MGGGAAVHASMRGERMLVDTRVVVLNTDGTPAENEDVYLVETVGGPVMTARMKTDRNGVIRLVGDFCGPMDVSVDHGVAVIQPGNLKKEYLIKIGMNGDSIKRMYGNMEPVEAGKVEEMRVYCFPPSGR
jgi:hypothetical protein